MASPTSSEFLTSRISKYISEIQKAYPHDYRVLLSYTLTICTAIIDLIVGIFILKNDLYEQFYAIISLIAGILSIILIIYMIFTFKTLYGIVHECTTHGTMSFLSIILILITLCDIIKLTYLTFVGQNGSRAAEIVTFKILLRVITDASMQILYNHTGYGDPYMQIIISIITFVVFEVLIMLVIKNTFNYHIAKNTILLKSLIWMIRIILSIALIDNIYHAINTESYLAS